MRVFLTRLRNALRRVVDDATAPAHETDLDFWGNLRGELALGRQWLDRAIVLVYAGAAGLLVVGLTLLGEAAGKGFDLLQHAGEFGRFLPLLWTPALTVLIVWWTRRFVPGGAGSGIQQVMRALDTDLPPVQLRWLVSLRIALHKVVLTAAGLLAGLSIGREGPTVQIGAGVMEHARRWLSPRSTIDSHDLMVAGAAAGIAAAFNTPLGGIVFALEALSRRRGINHSALVIAAIVLSGMVAVSVFGNETYFGTLAVQDLNWMLLWPGVLVALSAGLAGGLFARLVVATVRGLPDRFSRLRRTHPLRFAAVCGFLVALIGLATGGATAGAGYETTRALLEGHGELPGVYTLLKFCATWLSACTGAPAGMFAPSLAIGAGLGHDIGLLAGVGPEAAIPLIALGMVGFLAAVTQEPITAFIIVMEMVSGHAMVLSLMSCALVASGVSRLVTRPMYGELATLLVLPGLLGAPAGEASAEPPKP
jgi:H+/Cl- antiporter ClcA